MLDVTCEYLAAGGNRHPSAADWAPGLLAFGAGKNLALWNPEDTTHRGITALLSGHSDVVNAVKILELYGQRVIITGSADKTVRIWTEQNSSCRCTQCLTEHQGSVNTIALLPKREMFATGAADGTIKIWKVSQARVSLLTSILLKPHFIPLAMAMVELDDGTIVLAVSGTSKSIHVYSNGSTEGTFQLQTSLAGHDGWIRSLDFIKPRAHASGEILLASASQDKFIRLWRISKSPISSVNGSLTDQQKKSLSNKVHQVGRGGNMYNVMFEALLVGHEDWIYTVKWAPQANESSPPRLLSASADNSLAIWEADPSSGIWICHTRLGEISSQKGSTTATGSTGGFWIGLWNAVGNELVSLGRTGSWRRWRYDRGTDTWIQQLGISGHTQEVRDAAWASEGSYVVSTSADQTTRLIATWKRAGGPSWHEFARPQIHGYDLNCIDSLNPHQFVSGADEKLLRVFNKPRATDTLLSKLSGATSVASGLLCEAADIPVLGLSNKAVASISTDAVIANGTNNNSEWELPAGEQSHASKPQLQNQDHPPFEEHLARSTLWPEHEKLYGHGYEISAVAATHDGTLIATACKASTIEHAVIRVYETAEWHEIKPALPAHNLTVTALAFSHDDKYLLSVGRDRQWTLFMREGDGAKTFKLAAGNPKAHSRMILDCSWFPHISYGYAFATAGRDKSIRIWKQNLSETFDCVRVISLNSAATAVACDNMLLPNAFRLAYGGEDGEIHVATLGVGSMDVMSDNALPNSLLPSGAINALCWRPTSNSEANGNNLLAVASDDASLRILNIGP